MISDGRVVKVPLDREMCLLCGLARRFDPSEQRLLLEDYASAYRHSRDFPAGEAYDGHRGQLHARWIALELGDLRGVSILEVGCASGTLLSALREQQPTARLSGVEPSIVASSQARLRGLDVHTGSLDSLRLTYGAYRVVLSVNVIEHVSDPRHFLKQMANHAEDSGCIVVICPNGDVPSTELLMYDHLHSFTSFSLELLARSQNLSVQAGSPAPEEIGPFRLVQFRKGDGRSETAKCAIDSLRERRQAFLAGWQHLDERLHARIAQCGSRVACFGTGEKAMLLRAYAPRVWNAIDIFTSDGADDGQLDGRPVLPFARMAASGKPVLLAVRPSLQPALALRLHNAGFTVIRWDDLALD